MSFIKKMFFFIIRYFTSEDTLLVQAILTDMKKKDNDWTIKSSYGNMYTSNIRDYFFKSENRKIFFTVNYECGLDVCSPDKTNVPCKKAKPLVSYLNSLISTMSSEDENSKSRKRFLIKILTDYYSCSYDHKSENIIEIKQWINNNCKGETEIVRMINYDGHTRNIFRIWFTDPSDGVMFKMQFSKEK